MTSVPAPDSSASRTGKLLALSAAVPCALFLLTMLCVTPLFQITDDAICSMLSGGVVLVDRPYPHLMFLQAPLGLGLSLLGGLIGPIAYGIQIYFGLLLAAAACNYALLRVDHSQGTLAWIAILDAIWLIHMLTQPTFTVTACLLATSSALLLLSLSIKTPEPPERFGAGIAAAGFLGLYGFVLRTESFYLVVLTCAPLASLPQVRAGARRLLEHRRTLLGIALCFAVSFGLDLAAYRLNPDLVKARSEKQTVSPLANHNRFRYSESRKQAFDAVGWTRNDIEILRAWYPLESREEIARKFDRVLSRFPLGEHYAWRLSTSGEVLSFVLRQKSVLLIVAALLLLAPGLSLSKLACVASVWAASMLILFGVHLVGKEPVLRVYLPLFAQALLFAALFHLHARTAPDAPPPVLRTKGAFALTMVLLSVLAAGQAYSAWRSNRSNADRVASFRADVASLDPKADHLYVGWVTDFPWVLAFPPLSYDPSVARMKMIFVAWPVLMPFTAKRLSEFGAADLSEAILSSDRTLVLAKRDTIEGLVLPYFRQRHDPTAGFEEVFTGKTFRAFRFCKGGCARAP